MAKKQNRKCLCCGKEYEYCPTCGSDRYKPTYMTEFCSEECKDLWSVCVKFNMDLIKKAEAKEAIEKLNLKPYTEYVECVQKDLKNILKEEQKQVKTIKQTHEGVKENE